MVWLLHIAPMATFRLTRRAYNTLNPRKTIKASTYLFGNPTSFSRRSMLRSAWLLTSFSSFAVMLLLKLIKIVKGNIGTWQLRLKCVLSLKLKEIHGKQKGRKSGISGAGNTKSKERLIFEHYYQISKKK